MSDEGEFSGLREQVQERRALGNRVLMAVYSITGGGPTRWCELNEVKEALGGDQASIAAAVACSHVLWPHPRRAALLDDRDHLVERFAWGGLGLFMVVPFPGTGSWGGYPSREARRK
jgi:hypothetical protein